LEAAIPPQTVVTQLAAQEGSAGIDCPSTNIDENNNAANIDFIVCRKVGGRVKMNGVIENRNNHAARWEEENS